jgi:MFS family permease
MPPSPDKNPYGRAIVVGLCLFFLAGLAESVMMPFFALWARTDGHIPTAFIGLLLACYAGGELIATPLLGGIADRLGRRPVLLITTGGVGLGFLGLYLVHGVWPAALVLIIIGVFECALHPTILTVIADVSGPDRVKANFARVRVASNAGRIVGPLLGALLVTHALKSVFIGSAVACLAGTAIVTLFLKETRVQYGPIAADDEDEDEGLGTLLPAFRDRRLLGLLMYFLLMEVSSSWIDSILPLFASDRHILSHPQIGLLFTYESAIVVVFQMLFTRLTARATGFRLVVLGGAFMVLAFLILIIAKGAPELVCAITVVSIAQILFGPLVSVTVNEMAPASARAGYMAAISTVNDLKDSLGPATGTALYALSARLPWFLGIPAIAVSALGLAIGIRRHEKGIRPKAKSLENPE